MFRNLTLLLLVVLTIAGCSSREVQKIDGKQKESAEPEEAMKHFIEGSMADLKGDYATAISEYQRALRYDPTSAGIYYSLGKDYLLLEKLPGALQNARIAVKLDSSNTEYLSLLAEVFMNANLSDSATTVYEKIIMLDSTDTEAFYNLAYLYEQSKPLRSLEIYGKLLEITGPEWNILIRIAEIYEKLGKTEESVSTLEELLKLDPSNTELRKLLTELYIKTSRFDDALKNIEELSVVYPNDIAIKELKAQVYLGQNKWSKAAPIYSEILKSPDVSFESKMRIGSVYLSRSIQDSTLLEDAKNMFLIMDKDTVSWQIKMILGEIALQEKDDSTAQNYFKQVTNLANWNADAYVRLGGVYFDNKRYSESVSLLKDAVINFPDNFVINLILGLSYSQLNNADSAGVFLKKAVDLNPKDLTALSAYGFTLNQLKRQDDAVYFISEALKINPDNVDLLGTLGLIYNSQKNYPASDSAYSKAISIDTANALILNNYAYSLAERGIKLKEALQMAKRALKTDPLNSSYLDTIGWVYFMMGDYSNAEEYVAKAMEIDSNNATLLEHLGDISFRLGHKNKAIDLWQRSYKINSDNPELKNKIEKGEL